MTTSSSYHLRFHLLFAPKLLEKILMFWLHFLTSHWNDPQFIAIYLLSYRSTETAFAKVRKAHFSFSLLNTSQYLSGLTLGSLKHQRLLRTVSHVGFWELAVSHHPFISLMAPLPPFSLLFLCSALEYGSPSGLCSPHPLSTYPWEVYQHRGFSYHVSSAESWKGTSDPFVCFCFSVFCTAPTTLLAIAPALPLRCFLFLFLAYIVWGY